MNTMRKFGILVTLGAALALTACGGSSGSSSFGGSSSGVSGSSSSSSGVTTKPAATITMSSSAPSIPADGSSGTTITALVLDASNNAISGASVTFSSSAGGVLENEVTTTNTSGQATATLVANGAAGGTSITVTATSGAATKNILVPVVSTQQTITLQTSSPQLPSNGSKPVTITAIVKNASNQLVPGVAVNFASTSGGITPVQTVAGAAGGVKAGTTDANGTAAATLTPAGDPTDRAITVTASNGTSQSSLMVNVVGTTLALTGPNSLILNNSGTYTVALLDSGNGGISGATVNLSSAAGNTLSAPSVTTDSTGHATFTMTAVKATNPDTLTSTALSLTSTESIAVSSESLTFTTPAANALIDIGTSQAVTIVWTNGGVAQTGQTITFSTTRGLFQPSNAVTTTAVTDGTGTATVQISSTTAGPATITATASGVSAQLNLTFIATSPTALALQASPTTVQTQGQSTITAIVRDASNNLVANQTVDFQLTDVTGGQLSAGSAITDVQGSAQVVYTASSTQSATNGVKITASLPATPAVTPVTVDLTVGGQTAFLSLGTGDLIGENATKTQFQLPYIVQALDAAGNPVQNVTITLSVVSNPPTPPNSGAPDYTAGSPAYAAFWKGSYVKGQNQWVQTFPATDAANGCLNEDVNGTGIFEASEDLNQNGRLDPGNVASVSPSSVVTDSTGSGTFTIYYPESYATWVQVKLSATTTVSGTQSSTSTVFILPILAAYITNLSASPPAITSPYGSISSSCASAQ